MENLLQEIASIYLSTLIFELVNIQSYFKMYKLYFENKHLCKKLGYF